MDEGIKKTQNLMLISNPLEKFLKYFSKKSYYKRGRKIEFLTFITVCKIFLHFFQWIRIQHLILRFMITISNLFAYISTFCCFDFAKIGPNGSKKRTTYLINVS
jgi:hypothetical protein